MVSRLLFFVVALFTVAKVVAESDLPVTLAAANSNTGSHRTVGIKVVHKRGPKPAPKGRGGRATWFKPGRGNCGGYNKESDMIVALPMSVYSGGKYCGKKVKITNTANNRSCYAKIVDSCPGCAASDLDVSPSVFAKLSDSLDEGTAPIKWDLA
ncbi:hypothetical protein RSOLAG1IB_04690 [Rhizoctonia solani AG-1 IB]|uniref:Barwin domain-containing protein n=1 Tax=Thanatephorus cucumeris (strain AG1-IB / isolate 7/3/14) TaxID=1108050 RepID=M5C1Z0_THACB|nr:hypothetical protein BN14_03908 [Rhizoctonia solani AG-1 IB]CEL61940.1 hypothetical protein RSOLAG1IB_04690 [Rhizoctonia solani AG-1 IB]